MRFFYNSFRRVTDDRGEKKKTTGMNTIDEKMKRETIKIGICDFGHRFQGELKRLINSVMPQVQICGYESAEQLLSDLKLQSRCPEILFLDIAPIAQDNKRFGKKADAFETGQVGNGMEIADYISKEKEKAGKSLISGIPLVIFVTGETCQMKDVMGAHVFAYLERPFRISRVRDVVKNAVRELGLYHRMGIFPEGVSAEEEFLIVKTGTEVRKIPFSGILYVESMSRKVIVKLADEKIVYYDRISNLEKVLGAGFYRIHRGYLVSLKYVIRCSRTEVEIAGGEKLPISKYRYSGFVGEFETYIKDGFEILR